MGTSSIFNGRNDRNPLLPEDYENGELDGNEFQEKVKWQTVKSDMSKYIKSGGHYGSTKHIAQQYVKAAGGSHKMATQSHSGIKAGANIGGFFNSIRSNGIENTLKNLGIEYAGKSVDEVFSRLVSVVAPDSNTKEDIVAKKAVIVALSEVYDYIENNSMNIECMDSMSPEMMNEVLSDYVGAYIWITMMKDLGSRLEKYISDAQNAAAVEKEFKDMIFGIVDVEFKNKGDIINQDVAGAMNELYGKCLQVLEGII